MNTKHGYIQFSKLILMALGIVWLVVLIFGMAYTWVTKGPLDPVLSFTATIGPLVIPYTATSIVDKGKDIATTYLEAKTKIAAADLPPIAKSIVKETQEVVSETEVDYTTGPGFE